MRKWLNRHGIAILVFLALVPILFAVVQGLSQRAPRRFADHIVAIMSPTNSVPAPPGMRYEPHGGRLMGHGAGGSGGAVWGTCNYHYEAIACLAPKTPCSDDAQLQQWCQTAARHYVRTLALPGMRTNVRAIGTHPDIWLGEAPIDPEGRGTHESLRVLAIPDRTDGTVKVVITMDAVGFGVL
jgi:hypothetical protein